MSTTILSKLLRCAEQKTVERIGPYFYVIMPDGSILKNDRMRTSESIAKSPQYAPLNYKPEDIIRVAYDPNNHVIYFIDYDVTDMENFSRRAEKTFIMTQERKAIQDEKDQTVFKQIASLTRTFGKKDDKGRLAEPIMTPGTVEDYPYVRKVSDYEILKSQLEKEVQERGGKFVDVPVIELPDKIAKQFMQDRDCVFLLGEIIDENKKTLYSGQQISFSSDRLRQKPIKGPAIILNRDAFRPSRASEKIKKKFMRHELIEDPVDYVYMQSMIYSLYHAHFSNIINSDMVDNTNTAEQVKEYNNKYMQYISYGQPFFEYYYIAYNPKTHEYKKYQNTKKLSSDDLTEIYKKYNLVCLSYAYKKDKLDLGIYIFPDKNLTELKDASNPFNAPYRILENETKRKIKEKSIDEAGDRFWDLQDPIVRSTIMTIQYKRIQDYPLLWSHILNIIAPHYNIPKKDLINNPAANIQVVSINAPIGPPGTKALYLPEGKPFPEEINNILKKEIVQEIESPVIFIDGRWKVASGLSSSIVHEYAHHLGNLFFFGVTPASYGLPGEKASQKEQFNFLQKYLADDQEKLAHSVEIKFDLALGTPRYKILDKFAGRGTDEYSIAVRNLYNEAIDRAEGHPEELASKYKLRTKEAQTLYDLDVNRWWNKSTEFGISPWRGNPIGEGNNEGILDRETVPYPSQWNLPLDEKLTYELFAEKSWENIVKNRFSTERRLENSRTESIF